MDFPSINIVSLSVSSILFVIKQTKNEFGTSSRLLVEVNTPKIYIYINHLSFVARLYKKIDVYHLSYFFVLEIYQFTKKFPASEEQNITS